jgi:Amt family ammonium transporter
MASSFKTKTEIDDTLDVFPCHGLGGIVGMILTGVFAKEGGLITGETRVFSSHMIALVLVMSYCFIVSYALYWISNFTRPLRVSAEDELLGLDLSQHGEHL